MSEHYTQLKIMDADLLEQNLQFMASRYDELQRLEADRHEGHEIDPAVPSQTAADFLSAAQGLMDLLASLVGEWFDPDDDLELVSHATLLRNLAAYAGCRGLAGWMNVDFHARRLQALVDHAQSIEYGPATFTTADDEALRVMHNVLLMTEEYVEVVMNFTELNKSKMKPSSRT